MFYEWINIDKTFKKNLKIKGHPFCFEIHLIFPLCKLSEEIVIKIKKIPKFPLTISRKFLSFLRHKIHYQKVAMATLCQQIQRKLKKILKKSPVQIKINFENSKPEKANYLGYILVIFGIFLFSFPYFFQKLTPAKNIPDKPPSFSAVASSVFQVGISGEKLKVETLSNPLKTPLPPKRILIPKVGINLEIVEAKIKDGFWETSETKASHGEGSATPGEIGNMVIFAHARDNLFGPLRGIMENDLIYVLSKDKWFEYEVKDIKSVNPDEIGVIAPTKDETLTLYTCTGFFDSQRLIVVSKLKSS